MRSKTSEIKALATTYILLFLLLMLNGYALWTHWYLASLPLEESRQHGIFVRGAPALLMLMVVPPMLVIIANFAGQLRTLVRQHWKISSLITLGALAILANSISLLLAEPHQLGAADRVVGAILLIPLTMLVVVSVGFRMIVMLDKRTTSR